MFVCVCASSSCLEWSSSNSNSRNMLAVCLFYLLYATLYLFPFFFILVLLAGLSQRLCVCVCAHAVRFFCENVFEQNEIFLTSVYFMRRMFPTQRIDYGNVFCLLLVCVLRRFFFSADTKFTLYYTKCICFYFLPYCFSTFYLKNVLVPFSPCVVVICAAHLTEIR